MKAAHITDDDEQRGNSGNGGNNTDGHEVLDAPTYEQARAIDHESVSLWRDDTISNADLYNMTPPPYAESALNDEVSLDAEAVRHEKIGMPGATYIPSGASERIYTPDVSEAGREPPYASTSSTQRPMPDEEPQFFISEQQKKTATAKVRGCAIIPDLPAVWLVKKKEFALSALAATVLVKKGILSEEDLQLIPISAGTKRDPNDPLTGVFLATYDTVGDIFTGLVEAPVEAARQAKQSAQDSSKDQSVPKAAKEIAVAGGKGLGRIVGASLKAPMTFTHGVTRGFHNLPKMYGDEVREYENVTDLRSGLEVSAKNFAYGIGDGLRDFFVQPVQGAQDEGGIGFLKGVGKGIGNLVCKPAAGAVGLVGYTSTGIYKQLLSLKPGGENDAASAFRKHGETQYQQTSDQTRSDIVKEWCRLSDRAHTD